MEEKDGRTHTIRVDDDTELNLRIPDIIDMDQLRAIVEKAERLEEKGAIPRKIEHKAKPKKEITDMEAAIREYKKAPWGQKSMVPKKYGINPEILKWNIRQKKLCMLKKVKEGIEYRKRLSGTGKRQESVSIINSDLWKDYQEAPFGQKQKVANKYRMTLATLRTRIHEIRKRTDMTKGRRGTWKPKRTEGRRKKYSDELIDKAIGLLKKGFKSKEVAEIVGMKPKTMYDTLFNRRRLKISDIQKK